MKRLLQWLDKRFPIISTWNNYLANYYVPKNLNLLYVLGSIALVILFNQFITGLWLTMFYTPNIKMAFSSIEYIMRDVNYGWLLRYMHSTGASAFFIVIYLHIFRGLLYGSYKNPRELVWLLGMLLFVLLLAEAFFGYLLPWGQTSYWGAEVISSFFEAIPYVGKTLVVWLRGDYSVGNPTLQRFFALHVIGVAFVIVLMVYLHVVALHKVGSNNPQGIDMLSNLDEKGRPKDALPFYPYYVFKDLLAVIGFLILFFAVVFFIPDFGGLFLEPNNYIPADPMITPDHIRPLWYMAPFYSILRSIPDKLIGIIVMSFSLGLPFALPWLDLSPVRSMHYKGKYSRVFLGMLTISFLSLTYLGLQPISPMHLLGSRIALVGYFSYFLLMPFYTLYERTKPLPLRPN